MAFAGDDLFLGVLGEGALLRIRLEDTDGTFRPAGSERLFAGEDGRSPLGRIRDVVSGPDGVIYVLTSNRDGRGTPSPGDDRIYRLVSRP
jgi:glucose/arabinose dehydrogenase